MATVESAVQVILKDYLDFQNDEEVFLDNSGQQISSCVGGPTNVKKSDYEGVSNNRVAVSNVSWISKKSQGM